MDILDNAEFSSDSTSGLTKAMKNHLTETARWAKFLAIIGFIGIGFIILLAFAIGMIFEKLEQTAELGQFGFNVGAALTFFYLLAAIVGFFPVLYMFNFATAMLKSIPAMNVFGIERALSNLKSLFKFYGIFTIIILGFYVLLLLIGIVGGGMAAAMQ